MSDRNHFKQGKRREQPVTDVLYLVLLLLLLMTQRLLPLLLHPQLPRLLQHPLVVGHRLHLVDTPC